MGRGLLPVASAISWERLGPLWLSDRALSFAWMCGSHQNRIAGYHQNSPSYRDHAHLVMVSRNVQKTGTWPQPMNTEAGKGSLQAFSLQPPPITGANTDAWSQGAPACARPESASWLETPSASQWLIEGTWRCFEWRDSFWCSFHSIREMLSF